MILLIDIGNTHTHLGLANGRRIIRRTDLETAGWLRGGAARRADRFVGATRLQGAVLCSVVPRATPRVRRWVKDRWGIPALELTAATLRGVGLRYPRPRTIGPDRLANAVALRHHHGAPSVAVDFGTALTFDVVDARGDYIGGIIAPGPAAMMEYLHEKTALLPRVRLREVKSVVGRSTEEAMLIGTVRGCRGLVRELVRELKRELGAVRLPVVTTGGGAALIAAGLPEITAVDPLLTLEGLRLTWEAHASKLPLATRLPRPDDARP